MGRFNTYQSDLKYTPESFEKIAMLPMEMRRRHDEITNTSDLIALNRANTSVSAPFESEAGRLNEDFLKKSADLAARMSKEGASDPGKLEELRRLKNEYNTQSAANGLLGRGVADKASIDKRKIDYFANGLKNNQSGEYIKANWEKELLNRNSAASLMLKDSPNSTLTPFDPADAPPSVDMVEKSTKLRAIMGKTASSVFEDGVTMKNGELELTQQGLSYSNASETNAKQIQDYISFMKNEMLDENSDVSQDMKYKANGDPVQYKKLKDNFYKKTITLAGLMLNESDERKDAYNQPSLASDGSGRAKGPNGEELGAPIHLALTTETGEAPSFTIGGNIKNWSGKHDLSPVNVESTLKSMEIEEGKLGSLAVKDPAWLPMKQTATRMMHIVGDFEAKNKDVIEKKFKEKAADFLDKYDIPASKAPKNMADVAKIEKAFRESLKGTEKDWNQSNKFFIDRFAPLMKEFYQESLTESGLDDNLLYTTEGYTIGVGKDADTLNTQIDNYVERVGFGNIKKYASSSGAKVLGSNREVVDIDEAFAAGSKIKFNTINTMNAKGYPSISFSIEPAEKGGDKRSFTVDFREEGKEIFTEVLNSIKTLNLDPISAKRIETMANNIRSTSLIPDIETENGKFKGRATYSKQQSDAIMKDYLTNHNIEDEFHAKGSKQSLTLNKAGYFTAKAASKNSEDFKPFSIENQVKKSLRGLKPGDPTYIAETARQVAAIHTLMGYNEGGREDSLDKGALSLETNPTKRKIFADAATQMHQVIYASPRPSQAEQDKALMLFYDKVKSFGLTSKDRTYAQQ